MGGLFENDKTIILNHKPIVAKPHPKHLPSGLRVTLKKDVHGEDDPLFSERLQRDGWALMQEWKMKNRGYPGMFETLTPEVRVKRNPKGSHAIQLTRSIESLDYSEQFEITFTGQSKIMRIDRASWVDWDQQGRLVFARDGKIFAGDIDKEGHLVERELTDLNSSKPEPIPAPDWAVNW
jgi:hypothetical protein